MKSNSSDKKWISIILLILALEVIWLLVDLKAIKIPFLQSKKINTSSQEAGFVVKNRQELKRRAQNQLIWEDLKEKETLYYQDSILTLSQSSAHLYLKDQTDLTLSENTLVTIEEPDDKTHGEIRLRFKKGDLKARNPFAVAEIKGDDWVVQVDKGSEISLRKNSDSYEFEILSGQATLTSSEQKTTLEKNTVVQIDQYQKIQKTNLTEQIKIKNKSLERLYTHSGESHFLLEWDGDPDKIWLQNSDEKEKEFLLSDQEKISKKYLFQWPLGVYKVRLQNNFGLSAYVQVEVLPAPKIYLKKPLPRERLLSNEPIEFVWTSESVVKEYILSFKNNKNTSVVESKTALNTQSYALPVEGDLFWQVQGTDEDGFLIPSFYSNEIFIREKTLEAPRLKSPKIEKSKNEESDLKSFYFLRKWNLFTKLWFFEAHANPNKSRFQITFEWEPVPKAHHYIIEISSRPDFRQPELIKKISTNKFVWKTTEYKKYFWRVAAESAKGQLGQFSAPSEILESEVSIVSLPDKPILTIPAKPTSEKIASHSETAQVFTGSPEPKIEPVTEPIILQRPPEDEKSFQFYWAPFYAVRSDKAEENVTTDLKGLQALNFGLDYRKTKPEKSFLSWHLFVSSQTWKAEQSAQAQSDLKGTHVSAEVLYHSSSSSSSFEHGFGLSAIQNHIPRRLSQTAIEYESMAMIGLQYQWSNTSQYYSISALSVSSGYAVQGKIEYRWPLFNRDNSFLGLRIQGWSLDSNKTKQQNLEAGFLFGIKGF